MHPIGVGFGALAWTILPRNPETDRCGRTPWRRSSVVLYSTALAVLVLSIPESARGRRVDPRFLPILRGSAAVAARTLVGGWIPTFLLPLTTRAAALPERAAPFARWRWALRFQVATLGLAFVRAWCRQQPVEHGPDPDPRRTAFGHDRRGLHQPGTAQCIARHRRPWQPLPER